MRLRNDVDRGGAGSGLGFSITRGSACSVFFCISRLRYRNNPIKNARLRPNNDPNTAPVIFPALLLCAVLKLPNEVGVVIIGGKVGGSWLLDEPYERETVSDVSVYLKFIRTNELR